MAKTTLLNFKAQTTEHTFELKDGEPVIDGGAITWDEVLEDWIMWNFKTPMPDFALPYHAQLKALSDAYDWEAHFKRCLGIA